MHQVGTVFTSRRSRYFRRWTAHWWLCFRSRRRHSYWICAHSKYQH